MRGCRWWVAHNRYACDLTRGRRLCAAAGDGPRTTGYAVRFAVTRCLREAYSEQAAMG